MEYGRVERNSWQTSSVCISYLLNFKVDAHDNQVVGGLFAYQMRMVREVLLAVIPTSQHACSNESNEEAFLSHQYLVTRVNTDACECLPKCLISFSYFSTNVLCFCSFSSSVSSVSGLTLTILYEKDSGRMDLLKTMSLSSTERMSLHTS